MTSNTELIAVQSLQIAHPQPSDLEKFLPWACEQLQLHFRIAVRKTIKAEYTTSEGKAKQKAKAKQNYSNSKIELSSDHKKDSGSPIDNAEMIVHVTTVYDHNEKLVELIFTDRTPLELYKLISLVTNYHQSLYAITVKHANKNSIYVIGKILDTSNVTDLCLDNCFVKEANYHMLLENQNHLRYLSLARCKLDDNVIEAIMLRLVNPLPASKTVAILNLSSNFITDVGAKHLADTLKSNRTINYVNLANNMISDEGAAEILRTMLEFPIEWKDLVGARSRKMLYLRTKREMVEQAIKELQKLDTDKKLAKKKFSRAPPTKKNKTEKESALKGESELDFFRDQAFEIVEQKLGVFFDPYVTDSFMKNEWTFCKGNNTLCYLNMAYNDLSYVTVKRFIKVLEYQRSLNRKPKGLSNVCIEGNNFPEISEELEEIDAILEFNLLTMNRQPSMINRKMKAGARPTSRRSIL